MAMSHSFVLWPAGWPRVRVMALIVMKRRKSAVRYNEVLTVSVRNATIKRRQMVHTLNELKPGVKRG